MFLEGLNSGTFLGTGTPCAQSTEKVLEKDAEQWRIEEGKIKGFHVALGT